MGHIELSIVIPTYNERDNVVLLVERLCEALAGMTWEAIFVDDDSADGTTKAVQDLAVIYPNVRCLHRINRRGLSSACIEGALSCEAPYICVMDADLQHDEAIIPTMLNRLQQDTTLDIVIGSRYIDQGGTGALPAYRVWVSRLATWASGLILSQPVRDPMSGFFIVRRSFFASVVERLSGRGFKILLDLLTVEPTHFIEVPYKMRSRFQGESKLNLTVVREFFVLILGRWVSRSWCGRAFAFGCIGCLGVVVHFMVLWLIFKMLGIAFLWAQFVAVLVGMTHNFILNNLLTYHDKQLAGADFFRGLVGFYLVCGLGAAFNLWVSVLVYQAYGVWWLAALAGILSGAIANFLMSAVLIWRKSDI